MNTLQQFETHNRELAKGLVDNEPVDTRYTVDPNDPIFDLPLNSTSDGKT